MKYATGSCQCKKIKFRVALPAGWCGHCHCHQCQRVHGAAFVTWVGFSTNDYKIIDPEKKFKIYNSGQADRGFCSNCGSHFYFKYKKGVESSKWKNFVYFTKTNFDSDIHFDPTEHIFYNSHVSWVKTSDTLPKK